MWYNLGVMENFRLLEIEEALTANLHQLGEYLDGKELWRMLYDGPNEYMSAFRAIKDWHLSTRDRVDKAITDWMMDSEPLMLEPIERFMLLLRFENAISMLDLLRRSRTPRCLPTIHLECAVLAEALIWSLTAFWDFCGQLTAEVAARTFLRGDGTTLVSLKA